MKNLVIIPARGGSKGIPKKNIKMLNGKPLITWSIKQALESSCVDRVIVSTDCDEIARVAKEYGADVPFMRPSDLSGDKATTESVMLHCLKWLEENENYFCDNVILLQATSPVRNKDTIQNAYKKFINDKSDSLLSVSEFWHFLWEGQGSPKALYDFKNRPRRQDINNESIKYKENGSIYITNSKLFIKNENRLCGKITSYVMSEEESFEIDVPLDWAIIESILKFREGK